MRGNSISMGSLLSLRISGNLPRILRRVASFRNIKNNEAGSYRFGIFEIKREEWAFTSPRTRATPETRKSVWDAV